MIHGSDTAAAPAGALAWRRQRAGGAGGPGASGRWLAAPTLVLGGLFVVAAGGAGAPRAPGPLEHRRAPAGSGKHQRSRTTTTGREPIGRAAKLAFIMVIILCSLCLPAAPLWAPPLSGAGQRGSKADAPKSDAAQWPLMTGGAQPQHDKGARRHSVKS